MQSSVRTAPLNMSVLSAETWSTSVRYWLAS